MTKHMVWGACVAALLTAACSTSYTPRPKAGLTPVLDSGQLDAVRNGQSIEVGRFGGGLVDAVQDNPRALEHAESFRARRIGGFIVEMVGLGGVAAGAGVLVGAAANDDLGRGNDAYWISYGLMIGGLTVELVGLLVEISADPHFFDAINVYNDDLESRTRQAMPPAGPPWPVAPPPAAPPPATPPPPAPEPEPEPAVAPTPAPAPTD